MSEKTSSPSSAADSLVEPHPIYAVLRFLRAAYYRKGIVLVVLTVSCLLGGFYYATTPRIYQSQASLLIFQVGEAGAWSAEMSGGRMAQDLMITYQNMMHSEKVLEAALKILPPNYLGELKDVAVENRVKALQDNLSVSIVRNATILNISYKSIDPQVAAAVLDSILSAYLDYVNRLHQDTSGELLSILGNEKVKLETQMRVKQNQLIDVRRNAKELGIRDGDKGNSVVVQRVISLNESWIKAHDERLNAQSQLAALQAAIRSGRDLVEFALGFFGSQDGEGFLEQLGINRPDPYMTARLNEQLMQDQAKRESALHLYGPAHHIVREIEQRIQSNQHLLQNQHRIRDAQLHRLGKEELARRLSMAVQQRLAQVAEREKLVLQSYEEAKRTAIGLDGTRAQLDVLELDWERLLREYDIVLERLKDIDLGQKSGMFRTSVLSQPEVARNPVSPRKKKVGMLSLVLGLGAGMGIVYLLDLLDDRFRSPEELQAKLRLPVLAVIRRLDPVAECGIDAVHTHVMPNASETEAFRTLRTALALAQSGLQRLVVSSSEPGDGKTTVTANLATAYAQSGKRTLLIDADMRRPGLTPLLDLKGQRGLSTVLRQDTPVAVAAEENLCVSIREKLDVLPSGPRPVNPTELLGGDRFSELLAWAETKYDQILIDSPPALVSDTAIIARLVDGMLLTVQPEKNRRGIVTRVTDNFAILGVNVLGIVLNRVNPEKGKGYGEYGYGYGYEYSYGHEDDVSAEFDHREGLAKELKESRRVA